MGEAWEIEPIDELEMKAYLESTPTTVDGESTQRTEESLDRKTEESAISEELTFTEEKWWMKWLIITIIAVVVVGLHVFLAFSIVYDLHTIHYIHLTIFPIVLFGLAYIAAGYYLILKPLYKRLEPSLEGCYAWLDKVFSWEKWGITIVPTAIVTAIIVAFFAWIIIDASKDTVRLRSFGGLIMYVIICVLISANPARIKWRPVIGGIVQQFVVGLIVLKWDAGRDALRFASDNVVTFLQYTTVGTQFTYGFIAVPPDICGFGSVFLYTSLQIIIYFGAIVSVLYYLGVIEFILARVGLFMQYTLGTTAAESLNSVACIFLGQTESALLIEPALETMTPSEIHAVMTAGFASIAGSLFAAYISFGACPSYLLSASVMSAGVSLATAKLIYPEVHVSKQKRIQDFKFRKATESNILECISSGAVHSAKFVFEIGANLIVYLALLAFFNATIGYLGGRVGYPQLTFNEILGYCFFPLAYMMGASDASDPAVAIDETLKVAELMGMKTVLNEFIAYQHLASMISDGTLKGARAQMIATYALCGFSNISMIGSQLGILGGMCPKRKAVFAKVVVRALIAGSITCFMTACCAGVLVEVPTSCPPTANSNCLNLQSVVDYWNQRLNVTRQFLR